MTSEPAYGTVSALVLFEMALMTFRASQLAGQVIVDKEVSERLEPMLIDLCARAGCVPPRVVLREDSLRGAALLLRKGQVDLLLSRRLVATLSDAQLRAIVAHELIHFVRNDLRHVKARSLGAFLGGMAVGAVAWLAVGYELKNLPIFVAGIFVGLFLILTLLSPLNRRCEFRADVEGAALTGDAGAAAESLVIVYAQANESRKRLYGRSPWRWLLAPMAWRMPTHPSLEDRIARLRQLA